MHHQLLVGAILIREGFVFIGRFVVAGTLLNGTRRALHIRTVGLHAPGLALVG